MKIKYYLLYTCLYVEYDLFFCWIHSDRFASKIFKYVFPMYAMYILDIPSHSNRFYFHLIPFPKFRPRKKKKSSRKPNNPSTTIYPSMSPINSWPVKPPTFPNIANPIVTWVLCSLLFQNWNYWTWTKAGRKIGRCSWVNWFICRLCCVRLILICRMRGLVVWRRLREGWLWYRYAQTNANKCI